MTTSEKIYYTKLKKLNENGGKCEVCGKLISIFDCQLAHRLSQTKHNLKTYGKEIIHHDLNLACICSLKCNSAVSISFATRPIESAELIEKIKKELKNDD